MARKSKRLQEIEMREKELNEILMNDPYRLEREELDEMSIQEKENILKELNIEIYDNSDLYPNDDEDDDSRNWE